MENYEHYYQFYKQTRIDKEYYKFLDADKLDNISEMATCLESTKQAKLTKEEMEPVDRPTGTCVINNQKIPKRPGHDSRHLQSLTGKAEAGES